jgi:SulP family sulfate permease
VLVVASGINDVDATGLTVLKTLARDLAERGIQLYFSGLKKQVRAVFQRGSLAEVIPEANLFPTKEKAIAVLAARYGSEAHADTSPNRPHPHAQAAS